MWVMFRPGYWAAAMEKISHWHVPIMGFSQSVEHESGVEKLWRKLRDTAAVGRVCSLVHPQRWNADFKALAEFIWRNSCEHARTFVYAYSWGGGHGFPRLAAHLQRMGIEVTHAVLCDPVYHHWLRPWRSLFAARWNPPIKIPRNVRTVDVYYQRQNTPQGATLRAADPGMTELRHPIKLEYTHEYIDDAPEWHGRVLQIVRGLGDDPTA